MMRSASSFVLLAMLTLGITGCDSGSLSSGSCAQTTKAGASTVRLCTDYAGLTSDQVAFTRVQCAGNADAGAMTTGTFSDSPCNTTGAIGGCRATSGSYSSTVWYFPGSVFTTETVRSICMQANLMFVAP